LKRIRMAVLLTVLVLLTGVVTAAPLAPLSRKDREELVDFARKALSGKVQTVMRTAAGGVETLAVAPIELKQLPLALRVTNPEQVFVTIFRDRAPSVRLGSRGAGLAEATLHAMTKARTLPSFEFYNYGEARNVTVLFERVIERRTVPADRWFADLPFMELGVHGMALTHEKRRAALPPSVVFVNGLDTRDEFIHRVCSSIQCYPRQPRVHTPDTLLWDKKLTKVELLNFETFLSRGPTYPTVGLYRVNDLAAQPWKEGLSVARWMGNVLVRQQRPSGMFFSRYDAGEGRYAETGYDIVDHCYAILTLCDLAAATQQKHFLVAAGRGVAYLKKQFRMETPKDKEPFVYVVFDRKAPLGAAAMAIVALDRYANVTGAVFHDLDMKLLGRFLLRQQYDDGSFLHYYRYDRNVPYHYRISTSYPGQAAWALAVLERRFGDEAWRKAGRRAMDYLVTRREEEMHWTRPPADIWLAAALHESNTLSADKAQLDYARRMARHVVEYQKRKDVSPDMIGSFTDDEEGSTRAAASRVRLLGEVATFTTEPAKTHQAVLETCRSAMGFVRLNELSANNTFFQAMPERAYGMVRKSSFDNEVRLDTTCHVIQALLWLERLEKMMEPMK